MSTSRHIFLQANTDNIMKAHGEMVLEKKKLKKRKLKKKKTKELKLEVVNIFEEEVLRNILIYSQGSMSLGDPIKEFTVGVDSKTGVNSKERIYFTIVPLFLFIGHKLYFKKFKPKDDKIVIETFPKLGGEENPISFYIDVDPSEVSKPVHFSLEMTLQYEVSKGEWEKFDFTVDPVLRVIQD